MGIIIYLEKAIDFSSREFSIIDGRQRLTTTFLIIYAIKQLLVNCNDTENLDAEMYNLIIRKVTNGFFVTGAVSVVLLSFGSVFILAGGAFEKETDSNKVYAYSASIIALVSCIVSIIALLGM